MILRVNLRAEGYHKCGELKSIEWNDSLIKYDEVRAELTRLNVLQSMINLNYRRLITYGNARMKIIVVIPACNIYQRLVNRRW